MDAPRAHGLAPADIAIVGMSAIMPGAPDLRRFFELILDKTCALTEVPADRWPAERYVDAPAGDRIASKWGGFLPDVAFDPMRWGIPPAAVASIDPAQLLALVAAEAALADAGMAEMAPALRQRAAVILGFTGGLGELGLQYAARAELARALPDTPTATLDFLPDWTSDSFAGLLPNVVAGRIANRFDLGGANFVVDAACATSLAALRQGVMELESGRSDVVLCGAVEAGQGPFAFTCFSKAQALSPRGRCRAFDAAADGTAIAEGIAMLVLRRLADAEAAGERIYAVIKGIDGSSDGRAKGLMAPRPEGQRRALDRAYAQAGYSPASVALFEAHGTGTIAGDAAEIESLSALLSAHGASPQGAALGSVKTLIGHAEGAAGLAGVVKAVLALHHRVLPPHAGVEAPNPALGGPDGPLALYAATRPWLAPDAAPRRAGVSAFGFGGANFHVALQEHRSRRVEPSRPQARDRWPCELFVWRAADRASLAALAAAGLAALEAGARPLLGGLARALWLGLGRGPVTMAIVAGSHETLAKLLGEAVQRLGDAADAAKPLPPGLTLADMPLAAEAHGGGRVAMLFAGQGSQYPDMAGELAAIFPEVADALSEADDIVADTPTYCDRPRLATRIFPPARFDAAAEAAARSALAATDVAQPALGAVEVAMLALTETLGLAPAMVAGHSYGEYVALHAAGVVSRRDMLRLSEARGRAIVGAVHDGDLGTMAAVAADAPRVRAALAGQLEGDGVVVANLNAPNQTVISGARAAVTAAIEHLSAQRIAATPIPVAAAFHSPLMQPAQAPLARFFDEVAWAPPRVPVYANTTAAPHDSEPAAIRALLARHLTEPVDFVGTIEAMHAAGARVFLEIGPKSVLTGLTRRILGDKPHAAVAIDGAGGGLAGLLNALAVLVVQGVDLDLARLFAGRDLAAVDLADWTGSTQLPPAPTTWLVNGSRARRADAKIVTAVARAPATEAKPTRPARRTARESDMHGSNGPVRDDDEPVIRPASGVDRAMAEHHETMRQFLQMQERLMLAYLDKGGGQAVSRPARPFSTPRPAPTDPALAAPRSSAPARAAQPAAVAPAVAAPAAAVAAAPVSATAGDAKAQLLAIAAERTGYPEDMLGLDMDLEADLGIDSIKRVEILGAFRKAQPAAVSAQLQPHMEQVAKAKTLQEVLDRLATALAAPAAPAPPAAAETLRPFEETGSAPRAALARYVMRAEAEALPPGQPTQVAKGLWLVVPDRLGVAAALAALIERDGAAVLLVPDGLLDDDAALAAWLDDARAKHRIRGLVGLAAMLPLDDAPRDALAWRAGIWRAGMESCVKSLFPLLRLTASDLAQGGSVLVASAMGGVLCRDALSRSDRAFPGAGGGVGLIKTLAMEWPACRCKAVDLDLAEDAGALAANLHAELAATAGRREVGYPRGIRTIFRTTAAPLERAAAPVARPDKDWVVLAVGGARGITAETLRPFAAAGATCVLVSRAALPGPEDTATVPHEDPGALRRHFLKTAAAAGTRPTPAKIEAKVQGVLREREIRANLADFAALGAALDDRACDVRDESQVEALLEALYARYGRIDAVLLGAGLIEDRLITDKTRESLDRVFDTKVDGAAAFARHLRPESLRFLALFSSVAGRYGNRGQADYAAANEVLNRLAWQLQARFGAGVKVVSVNWGAWARTSNGPGMLTPETARQFRERGLKLIEPEEGGRFLMDELMHAPPGEVEVVAGEHAWDAYEEAAGCATQADARRVA